MEVVLLWLDEFDELVLLWAMLVARIRSGWLATGGLAALPVPLLEGRANLPAAGFAVLAAACVLAWLMACVVDSRPPHAGLRADTA